MSARESSDFELRRLIRAHRVLGYRAREQSGFEPYAIALDRPCEAEEPSDGEG